MFDADGVLQGVPGGWVAATEPYLGERTMEFLIRSQEEQWPILAGQGDHLAVLAATLADFAVGAPAEEVYRAIWLNIAPAPESIELVRALRANGYGVHLATNQERYRARHMREVLGYDALFDVSCYSHQLGVIKPSPEFFTEAVRRVGAEPATILFIDDDADNVDAARTVGLSAVQWSLDRGHDELLSLLAAHGVSAARPAAGQPETTT